jgi:seryl-tRNA synthetase
MSAATEEILLQINDLELQIQLESSRGRDVRSLMRQLENLKEQLQLMNETLKKSDKILKG